MSDRTHMRRMTPPPVVVGGRKLNHNQSDRAVAALKMLVGPVAQDMHPGAPITRAHCVAAVRPCPWVSCRHHLALDVTDVGGLRITWPALQIGEVLYSCALDVVVDYPDGLTQDTVGQLLNLSHERIRQIEQRMQRKLQAAFRSHR